MRQIFSGGDFKERAAGGNDGDFQFSPNSGFNRIQDFFGLAGEGVKNKESVFKKIGGNARETVVAVNKKVKERVGGFDKAGG